MLFEWSLFLLISTKVVPLYNYFLYQRFIPLVYLGKWVIIFGLSPSQSLVMSEAVSVVGEMPVTVITVMA